MPKSREVSSFCAMTIPPPDLTAWTPSVASRPYPVSTTAMARRPWWRPADSKSGFAEEYAANARAIRQFEESSSLDTDVSCSGCEIYDAWLQSLASLNLLHRQRSEAPHHVCPRATGQFSPMLDKHDGCVKINRQ